MASFEPAGGIVLALARAMTVAGLLSTFGTLVFVTHVAPRAFAQLPEDVGRRLTRRLLRTARFGAGLGMGAALAWVVLQAGDMAQASSWPRLQQAIPPVLFHTAFGHVALLQLATLALCLVAVGPGKLRSGAAIALSGAATVLQAGHGHAAAMRGGDANLLLVCDALHLLAAGAWLGGLLPLLIFVRDALPRAGATAARWFSPMGQLCIAILAVTSAVQGWVLVGSIPGLVGTAYGAMVLVKLGLFGALLGFAWVNRYRFAPALLGRDPASARRVLIRSLAGQTAAGVAIIAAASLLSSLAPAMHEQPLWPFSSRFTWDTIGEDPEFRREVVFAALALVAAAGLAAVGIFLRHWARWLAAFAAVLVTLRAVPHLDLLFVPAYPTSFYQSPTGFTAMAIMQGARLYPEHCAACHGADGRGNGAMTAQLAEPAADLTAAHLWMHSDGELFWWLSHGIEAPNGELAMPGFADTLSDDARWDLIDMIRARNAGLAFQASGSWPVPLQAPDLAVECTDGPATSADFRGQFLRVAVESGAAVPGITTILLTTNSTARPSPGLCVATDQAARAAYALITGLPADALAGAQFLADGGGWLRAMQPRGAPDGWDTAPALSAELRKLRSSPVGATPPMAHMQM